MDVSPQLFNVLLFSLLTQLYSPWWKSVLASPTLPPTDQPDTSTTIDLLWSENISSRYPPSDPLEVKLGDILNFTCPQELEASSNIWIQNFLKQYEECDCNAVSGVDCAPTTNRMQVCKEEAVIRITLDSQNLNTALTFQPNTTYYLISYSEGGKRLAGITTKAAFGGECLKGFRMALYVQPKITVIDSTETLPPTISSTTKDPKKTFTKQIPVPKTTKSSEKLSTQRIGFLNSGGSPSLVLHQTIIFLLSVIIAFYFVSLC